MRPGAATLGRTFLVTEAMGVVQFGIGNLGTGNASWEGSLPHILLHGGVGCVAILALNGNCASGFFAGASQAVLAGSGLSNEQKAALAPLVGAAGAFLWADGQAINVSFGSTIAQSGFANNYLTHEEAVERANVEAALRECQKSGSTCTAADISNLGTALEYWVELDKIRDTLLVSACRSGDRVLCQAALDDANAAYVTFRTAANNFTTREEYIASIGGDAAFDSVYGEGRQFAGIIPYAEGRAMNSASLPFDIRAFGLGLAAGGLLGLQGVAGSIILREAARLCVGNVACTAGYITKIVGEEVAAVYAGGSVTITSATGQKVVALLDPPAAVGAVRRFYPGVASHGGSLPRITEGTAWLQGSQGNAGRIPAQIAEQLSGMQFRNFDHFRQEFWKAVYRDPVLRQQFSPSNQTLMRAGNAPFAPETQQVGGRMRYEIDHLDELQYGGNVYDMDNLIIRTPLNHIRG